MRRWRDQFSPLINKRPLLVTRRRSLDDLDCAQEQRGRHAHAEHPRGLDVDNEIELGRLLNWQICRLRTLEYALDLQGRAAMQLAQLVRVGHEPSPTRIVRPREYPG